MSRGCRNHYGLMREEKWDELRALHAQGMSRNAISREMGITNSVVSRTAEHLGLAFDRAATKAAMEARRIDLAERRSLLAEQFVAVAEDSLDRVYAETTVYAFGGKDNEYNDHTFDEAPIAERQKLVTTAAIAVDKSLKLVPADASSGVDEAKSMLGNLGQLLTAYSQSETDDSKAGSGEA
ncbi:hypothetical protein ACIQPQ_31210 [Streptomyces sp. NPDC091281]|uniref:hypothetical protein n=1 Tax=Streptomyces sp. NPDC091281 TaxID=3365985 RepID=UPI003807A30F